MAQLSVQRVATKKVTRTRFITVIARSRWSLPIILVFQAALALFALQNTAFQDEALYLLAGRQIFNSWLGGPPVIDPYASYFSGYPYFYPVIGGVLDMLGGIELARMFSLACMLGITVCVYYAAKNLFDRDSAVFAAALYACQGPVLFMSRLATYDALCLFLLASATVVALHVSNTRRSWWVLAIGPLVLLAVAAKYAALLFVPIVFALLIWCSLTRLGWMKMFMRLFLSLVSLVAVSVVAFMVMDKNVLKGLASTTTNRVAIVSNSPLLLLSHIVTLGGIAFVLALLGILFAGWRRLPTGLLLFLASLLAPAYHLYKGELVSLDKHMAFGIFFIAPLAGYAVAYISGYRQSLFKGRYWLAGLAICLIMSSIGTQQAQSIYAQWASSRDETYLLRTQVRPGGGRYLAEEYDVCRYYLQDTTYSWQWSSLDFFTYTDKQKHQLVGKAAYTAAIQDGYFDLVELNFGYNASLAASIDSDLKASKKYDMIARIPYHNAYGNGFYWIWRKHVPTRLFS